METGLALHHNPKRLVSWKKMTMKKVKGLV